MAGITHLAWQGDHALCAWVDGEQVGMLEIGTQADRIQVEMVFVKPPFRRRGIGGALLRALLQRHPQALIPAPGWTRPTIRAARPVPAA